MESIRVDDDSTIDSGYSIFKNSFDRMTPRRRLEMSIEYVVIILLIGIIIGIVIGISLARPVIHS
jgi:hypothetical protein